MAQRLYAEGCSFCAIARGTDAARVVYETDDAIAFFPLAPAVPGHTLVIPKDHVSDIWALDRDHIPALSSAIMAVAWAVRRALKPDGMNLINSNGEAASQTVAHLHVHIVPRWSRDEFGGIWPESRPMSDAIKDDIANRIRSQSHVA